MIKSNSSCYPKKSFAKNWVKLGVLKMFSKSNSSSELSLGQTKEFCFLKLNSSSESILGQAKEMFSKNRTHSMSRAWSSQGNVF